MEKRAFLATEIRAANDDKLLVSGYAATYGVTATLPGFRERIASRAFDKLLRSNPDVCCLVNHDPNLLLGRTSSGTLRLSADDKGLRFACDLPSTSYGKDTYALVKRGDLAGMSFAFGLQQGDEDWSEENGMPLRTLRNFSSLHDVAICTYPAYSETSVDARQLESLLAEVRSQRRPSQNTSTKWREMCARNGVNSTVSFEEVLEQRKQHEQTVIARRRNVLELL